MNNSPRRAGGKYETLSGLQPASIEEMAMYVLLQEHFSVKGCELSLRGLRSRSYFKRNYHTEHTGYILWLSDMTSCTCVYWR